MTDRGGGRPRARASAPPPREPAPPRPGAPDDVDADPDSVARTICLTLLTAAPRSRGQLAEALRKRAVPDDAAQRVLDRLVEVGLVDDEAFAEAWVSSRHRGRGLAPTALRMELRRRGVDDEHIAAALDGLDDQTQLETARELAARKAAATAGLPYPTRLRRVAGLLARKGYPAGLAYAVTRETLAQGGPDLGPYDARAATGVPDDELPGADDA